MRELLSRMDARELTEWMAFEIIEPFGSRQEDLRAGILGQLMTALWSEKQIEAKDLFHSLKSHAKRLRPEQTWEEQQALLIAWTKAVGGKVNYDPTEPNGNDRISGN